MKILNKILTIPKFARVFHYVFEITVKNLALQGPKNVLKVTTKTQVLAKVET